MSQIHLKNSSYNNIILSCAPYQPDDIAYLFDTPSSNSRNDKLPGRAQVKFIETTHASYVIKHYMRGGFCKRLFHDRYFYLSAKHARPSCELRLLMSLRQLNLPVPDPVGCRIIRHGLFYKADLLMSEIPQAKPLSMWLQQISLEKNLWQRIGKVIKQFHSTGLYHADLNAHNILIDAKQKIWLIDFDRGSLRKPARWWQNNNLNRLKHSLLKLRKQGQCRFTNSDWQALLSGYEE